MKLSVDPLRESACRTLLALLAESGRFAAATELYRELRLLLHRELNATPDPQTTALYERLHGGNCGALLHGSLPLGARCLLPSLLPWFCRKAGVGATCPRLSPVSSGGRRSKLSSGSSWIKDAS
jgi:hypothetical protein